jgi:peroxiredoxin
VLTRFARAHQITFPMLSDKGSAVIRRYGILNTNIPPTHTFYGIPFPGEFLVAPDGRVADKVFLPDFQDRATASEVLLKDFGIGAGNDVVEMTRPARDPTLRLQRFLRTGTRGRG